MTSNKYLTITVVIVLVVVGLILSFPKWGKLIFSTSRPGYQLCKTIGKQEVDRDFEWCEILGQQFGPPWPQR